MRFEDMPLCKEVLEGLRAMNFTETTPVQEQAIPVILENKDLIACAQTGTGKTAAFILPLLHHLMTKPHPEDKINAIIMAPTRELAQQIDQQMEGFSYFTPFSSVAVYGGNDAQAWEVQKKGLQKGADVVIATPGRLLSHLNLYDIDFSSVQYFILDEADRMLDMGFYDDIMTIVKRLPKNRQIIMFSATMPPKIRQLAKTIMQQPVEIKMAVSQPPESIEQMAYLCYETQKLALIQHLFSHNELQKAIVFSGSKLKVKELYRTFLKMGLSVGEMHSDLEQVQREQIMLEFRNNRVNILVATDIVSRGIDIDDISMIVNYDVPFDAEDYVHRIGRTARAGDSGKSVTFASIEEQFKLKRIESFLGKDITKVPLPDALGETPAYQPEVNRPRKLAGRIGRKSGQPHTSSNQQSKPKNKQKKNKALNFKANKPPTNEV